MLLGCEPDLRVHDAVCRQVFDAFARDPFEGGGLHDRHRVRERLQIPFERTAVGGLPEPRRQRLRVVGGQFGVAAVAGQLQDRRGPQPAVEVIVQKRFGGEGEILRIGVVGASSLRR